MILHLHDLLWSDSQINGIEIKDDRAVISVHHDLLRTDFRMVCEEVVGMTDLCMWDDSIISHVVDQYVTDFSSGFLKTVFDAYGQNFGSGEYKALREGLIDLSVGLVNGIEFHIYCYKVHVEV